MAEEMEEEDWIKTAVPNEEAKDIIVTTTDGYIYQVYYDEETGKKEIDFVGKEDGEGGSDTEGIPEITASYDKVKAVITANASCKGGIKEIQLTYNGEIIQTQPGEIANFDVKQTGWYEVKGVANNGKTISTWVRVSSTAVAPLIEVISDGEIENDWYGKDDKPVEVKISTDNPTVTRVYYKTNKDEEYTYVEGKEATLTIQDPGRTIIYAYVTDKHENESEQASEEIKYDNIHPQVGDIEIEGTKGTIDGTETGWYVSEQVMIKLNNMTDEPEESGIVGFYYWEIPEGSTKDDITEEQKNYVKGSTGEIKITKEGKVTVGIQAKDKAGNVTESTKTITIYKDSIEPGEFFPSIVEESLTSEGFTIAAGVTDITSGISHYNFYVKQGSNIVKELKNNKTGGFQVTGLVPNTAYSIIVEAVDRAGNIRTGTGITVTTKGKILTPTITINPSTPNGNNGWYKTEDITVTINDGETDSTKSGVTQIVYTLDGATVPVNGRTATVTISTDGTHTVKAYATDGTTNSAETTTYTIKRDVTDPSASLSTPTNVTISGMTVTGVSSDSTSGVATYKFQASTSSSFSSIAKESTAQTSNTYTFSGLTAGTTYYLRVIVTDNAGRTRTSSTVTQATKTSGMSSSDLGKTTEIGKYVNYVPSGSNYTIDGTYSGTGSNQTFATDNSMKWRIWGVSGNKLLLISETLAGNIQLQGANGYNNGVKILNDACSTAFGNSSYGSAIKVRSINQDDIDKVTNMTTDAQRKAVNSNYGTTVTPRNYQWPNIYGQELGKTGGGSLDRSSQSSWYTGTTNSSFTGKWTNYSYSISSYATNSMYNALLTNMSTNSTSGTTSHTTYWVASRCVNFLMWQADFRMFFVGSGNVDANNLYITNGSTISPSYAVRPVVEVNLDSVVIGGTGSGTASSPYSMALK